MVRAIRTFIQNRQLKKAAQKQAAAYAALRLKVEAKTEDLLEQYCCACTEM